jgi:hypothetical protein
MLVMNGHFGNLVENRRVKDLEARVRIELTIEVLQTSALPLGYRAIPQTKTARQNEKPPRARG